MKGSDIRRSDEQTDRERDEGMKETLAGRRRCVERGREMKG